MNEVWPRYDYYNEGSIDIETSRRLIRELIPRTQLSDEDLVIQVDIKYQSFIDSRMLATALEQEYRPFNQQ